MSGMRFGLIRVLWGVVVMFGCGAHREGNDVDPVSLLKAGLCEDALVAAQSSTTIDPQTKRAVVAFCSVVTTQGGGSYRKAVAVLQEETGEMHAVVSAREMLDAALLFPTPLSATLSTALAEVALGAAGYGRLAPKDGIAVDAVGAATRALAVSVLERLAVALDTTSRLDTAGLLVIWNSCFSLMGGSFEAEDAHQAWRLYAAVAAVAIFTAAEAPNSDIAEALLGALVTVVEVNPDIQPAVRCDLASPFEELKNALAYKRPLLGRLEEAVKGAIGCTRGTYAP